MKQLRPDICVIGAGSGGLSVAAAAAAFGVDVVLIEKGLMGGDCLNYGCVPSKALIAAAKAAASVANAGAFGVTAKGTGIDFAKANDHLKSVIAAIAPHDSVERFEGLGVTVIKGHARFVSESAVRVGEAEVRARRFVIATGSAASIPPIPGLEDVPYLTNESLFGLRQAPEHLVIIGGGPIGMEMAQAHRRLGSRVTVVEAQAALGREDRTLAGIVLSALRDEGVEILEQTSIDQVARTPDGVELQLRNPDGAPRVLTGSHLLLAAGRKPVVDRLDLETAGIVFEPSGIKVDKGLRTTNRRVFAIGDAAGGLQFTHVAGYHAGLVMRSLLFRLPVKENRNIIPRVTYTSPELGHLGLSEAEAREHYGDKLKVLTADYSGNDRAQANGQTKGRLKLFAGPGGKLVGAAIAGAQAGEIINLLSLAISQNMRMKDLAGFVAPYPTVGELVRRAAISYYADAPRNIWVRRLIAVLRYFG
ncbi:NAD(P)/FAD-dependent oxidoreductase [Roseibium sp. RKSG952]|uniref:dihydrolipoyl dehydrogenase family protein n=1 Tax=Roseibium sp. RKSG952 TaxID=2529384 RepID=UPI0012BC1130|nr:FAD-dependent oxidoreductase [Roseibium sp. RKSG952]MTH97048.1 dihydrolipoamide dehydrogenase [Roseibium sp. RKSG952]